MGLILVVGGGAGAIVKGCDQFGGIFGSIFSIGRRIGCAWVGKVGGKYCMLNICGGTVGCGSGCIWGCGCGSGCDG